MTRNPMNRSQVKKIILSPETVDCFVFWTKDPENMLPKLHFLDEAGYSYYFLFTVTPYDKTIERNLRQKSQIVDTFAKLSNLIGKNRVLWRYDPIILNRELDEEYHVKNFTKLCELLHPHTGSVTVSFVDRYSKLKTDKIIDITDNEMMNISGKLSPIAKKFGLQIKACCEKLDLSAAGIQRASCIDKTLIEKICGHKIEAAPDKNQRKGCGCVQSTDIGAYNTCKNGCIYCYANYSESSVAANYLKHDKNGEFLI